MKRPDGLRLGDSAHGRTINTRHRLHWVDGLTGAEMAAERLEGPSIVRVVGTSDRRVDRAAGPENASAPGLMTWALEPKGMSVPNRTRYADDDRAALARALAAVNVDPALADDAAAVLDDGTDWQAAVQALSVREHFRTSGPWDVWAKEASKHEVKKGRNKVRSSPSLVASGAGLTAAYALWTASTDDKRAAIAAKLKVTLTGDIRADWSACRVAALMINPAAKRLADVLPDFTPLSADASGTMGPRD